MLLQLPELAIYGRQCVGAVLDGKATLGPMSRIELELFGRYSVCSCLCVRVCVRLRAPENTPHCAGQVFFSLLFFFLTFERLPRTTAELDTLVLPRLVLTCLFFALDFHDKLANKPRRNRDDRSTGISFFFFFFSLFLFFQIFFFIIIITKNFSPSC